MDDLEAGREAFDAGAAAILHLLSCFNCVPRPRDSGMAPIYCSEFIVIWAHWLELLFEYRSALEHIPLD